MADFLVVCDFPAFGDPEQALKDNMGRYVWYLLKMARAPESDLAVEFLYHSKQEMYAGRSRWRDIEARHKPKVVLCMGQLVFNELELEGKVGKCRGSVYTINRRRGPMYVVPTFSYREMKKPLAMYAEEPIEKGIYALHDITRAVSVYRDGWNVPEERFNLDPTVDEVEQFVEQAIEHQWLLGSDIEATGLNIEHAEIVVLGFAWNESDAICIPFKTQHGKDYYNRRDWIRVEKAIRRLFKYGKFMYQNGVGYDIPLLIQRGWKQDLNNFVMDTMVMHHTLSPESPHNIGFISSIYGKQPYWKDVFKLYLGQDIFIHPDIPGQKEDSTQQGMRLYNARDCVALHQIRNGMQLQMNALIEEDPIFAQLPEVLDKSMREARAVVVMEQSGLLLDKKRLGEWVRYLENEINTLESEIRDTYSLPQAFSLTSPLHKRFWIYGESIPKLNAEKLEEAMAQYDNKSYNHQYGCAKCGRKKVQKFLEGSEVPTSLSLNCPTCKRERRFTQTGKEPTLLKMKDRGTNKYKQLRADIELAKLEPLYKLKGYKPLTTDSEASALDKEAMVRYQIQIGQRLTTIANLRRRSEKHDLEEVELIKLHKTIDLIKKYNKFKKLQDSFVTFATRRDGRVYPHFMITGTSTGRLSCKAPNAQQIPSGPMGEKIRGCFKAAPGCELMSIDFENLEVWVGAYFMEDTVLQKILEDGINFHDFNTKVFFGIEEDDPLWGTYRKLAKIIVFARILYGGTDRGIYTKILSAAPDCGLTFDDFKQAIANYMKAHPEYTAWCKKVQALALTKRLSVNCVGRVRTLYGADNAIMRQALNSPVQGSAADLCRICMPDFVEYIERKGWTGKVLLNLQVHDEYVLEYPIEMRQEVALMAQEIMCQKFIVNGYDLNLKIDIEVGKYWGGMKGYDLEKNEIKKGSKH